jgi:hypothetical protein
LLGKERWTPCFVLPQVTQSNAFGVQHSEEAHALVVNFIEQCVAEGIKTEVGPLNPTTGLFLA